MTSELCEIKKEIEEERIRWSREEKEREGKGGKGRHAEEIG